jgi:prepilin-type N-terminal cleavage/methylation domain-containing protein
MEKGRGFSPKSRRKAFTLMEVLVSVAIAGLVVTAGFHLTALSLRTLSAVEDELALVNEAQKVYVDFLTKNDMPDHGERKDEEGTRVIEWRVEADSVTIADGMELAFRRLAVGYRDREMVLYLPK